MFRDLDRQLLWGLLISLLLVLTSSLLFFSLTHNQRQSGYERTRNQELIKDLHRLLISAIDTETAQRSYLVSNSAHFLEIYQNSLNEHQAQWEKARQRWRDNPDLDRERDLLEKLEASQKTLLEYFALTIQEPRRTLKLPELFKGEQMMSGLRLQIVTLQERLQAKVTRSAEKMNSRYSRITAMAAFTVVFSFMTLIASVIFLSRGLAQQKMQAQAYLESKARAEEASDLKSAFLANMSHEIRTPINGIIGLVDLLRATPLSDEQKNYVSVLKSSTHTMLALLNNVLDLSKIEAGQFRLEKFDFELPSLVRSIVSVFRYQAEEKQLKLELTIDENVPHGFNGDSLRLRQLLTNLIGNAVKFTAKGSVHVRVRVARQEGDIYVLLFEIQDTGPGVPGTVQDKLFHPFIQGDFTTTRQHGGSGLGLAICKQIVGMMNGHIGVRSISGQGSTFWFEIPLTHAPTLALSQESDDTQSESFFVHDFKNDFRILIAEDNPINGQTFVGMLKKMNLSSTLVDNGAKAVEAFSHEKFDLILMDCNMPIMDGYEAARRIRQLAPPKNTVPMIAITANVMIGDREKCIEAGMDEVISKPVPFHDLQMQILKYLVHNDLERQVNQALEKLRSLQSDENPGFLRHLKNVFLTDTQRQIQDAHAALDARNFTQLEQIAHSMKSSFASFGGLLASQKCAEIEKLARLKRPESLPAHLMQIRAEFAKLQTILNSQVEG